MDRIDKGLRLILSSLDLLSSDQDPQMKNYLLWNIYFIFHKIGDYETALHWLNQVAHDETISDLQLTWAKMDLYEHLGLEAVPKDFEGLRDRAVTTGDALWLAELDVLLGRIALARGDDVEGIAHLMLAAEGFRRSGASPDLARCLGALGEIWLESEKYGSALELPCGQQHVSVRISVTNIPWPQFYLTSAESFS